jgi:hydrogenase maturation protease
VEIGADWLRRWGVKVTPRAAGAGRDMSIEALDIRSYEDGRPSAEDACRIGDPRLLSRRQD